MEVSRWLGWPIILVVPCQNEKNKDELIYKEMLAYKLYENLSDIHLKTQPISLKIIETKNEKEDLVENMNHHIFTLQNWLKARGINSDI